MKALYILFSFIIIIMLTGCNATLFDLKAQEKANAIKLQSAAYECCHAGQYESGYYYNGYQENGWRYCIIRRD